MPRPSRFSEVKILDAAAGLVAAGGPGAATIGAIGAALDAPWGSIYHRFSSRHVLLGRLWLSKAAMFQNRFVEALAHPNPFAAGLEAALSLPRTARSDFAGARIMLLHRREDFFSDEWPTAMRQEAIRLTHQVDDALNDITRRLFGRVSAEALHLAIFAILDVSFAATRRHIAANEVPPAYVDDLVERAYSALIAPESTATRPRKIRRKAVS
jgi:AcrR family transcriptional regulator